VNTSYFPPYFYFSILLSPSSTIPQSFFSPGTVPIPRLPNCRSPEIHCPPLLLPHLHRIWARN